MILNNRNINFRNVFRFLMILFSLYNFYIIVGIYLNVMVNQKYDTVSESDIAYVFSFSKLFMIYIVLMLISLFFNFSTVKRS